MAQRRRRNSGSMLDGLEGDDETIEALERERSPPPMSNEQALLAGRPLMGNQFGGVCLPVVTTEIRQSRIPCRGCLKHFITEQNLINHLKEYKDACGRDVHGHFVFEENKKRCLKCRRNLKDVVPVLHQSELYELILHVFFCKGTKHQYNRGNRANECSEHKISTERKHQPQNPNRRPVAESFECIVCFEFQRDKAALIRHVMTTICGKEIIDSYTGNMCKKCMRENVSDFISKYDHYVQCQETSSSSSVTPTPKISLSDPCSTPLVDNESVNTTPAQTVSPPTRLATPTSSPRVAPPPPPSTDTQEDSDTPGLVQQTQDVHMDSSDSRTNAKSSKPSNERRNSFESRSGHRNRDDPRSSSLPSDDRASSRSRTHSSHSNHNTSHGSSSNQNDQYRNNRDSNSNPPQRRNSSFLMPAPPTPQRSHHSSSNSFNHRGRSRNSSHSRESPSNSSHHRHATFNSSRTSEQDRRENTNSNPTRSNSNDRMPQPPPPPKISSPPPPIPLVDLADDDRGDERNDERNDERDDEHDDNESVLTTAQGPPSVMSFYDPNMDSMKRDIVQNKIPTPFEMEIACRSCREHGVESTAEKGRKHLRREHSAVICPCCMDTIMNHGNNYKEHMQMHFIKKGSRREEVKCLFCKEIMNHEDMWEHIDEVHFAKPEDLTEHQSNPDSLNRTGLSCVSSPSQLAPGSQMPSTPLLEPIPDPIPMLQPDALRMEKTPSRGPEDRNHSRHSHVLPTTPVTSGIVFIPPSGPSQLLDILGLSTESTTSSAEPSSSECSSTNDENFEFVGARYTFSPDKLNEMAKEFVSNPNPPWDLRSKKMAKKLKAPYKKVMKWFERYRSVFMNNKKLPSWAKGLTYFITPDRTLHIKKSQNESVESDSNLDDEETEEGEILEESSEENEPISNDIISDVDPESEDSDDEESESPRTHTRLPDRQPNENSARNRSKKKSANTNKRKASDISSGDSEEDQPKKNKKVISKRQSGKYGRKRNGVIEDSDEDEIFERVVSKKPSNVLIEKPVSNLSKESYDNHSDNESTITLLFSSSTARNLTTNSTPNTPRLTKSTDSTVVDRNKRHSEPPDISEWATGRVLRSETSKEGSTNTSHSSDTNSETPRLRGSVSQNDSRNGSCRDSSIASEKSNKNNNSENTSGSKNSRKRNHEDRSEKASSSSKSVRALDRAEQSSSKSIRALDMAEQSSSKSVREMDKAEQSSSKRSKRKKKDRHSEPPEKRKRSSDESGETHRVKSSSASKVVIQIIRDKTNSPPVASAGNIENDPEQVALRLKCQRLTSKYKRMRSDEKEEKITEAMKDEIEKCIAELESMLPVRGAGKEVIERLLKYFKELQLSVRHFLDVKNNNTQLSSTSGGSMENPGKLSDSIPVRTINTTDIAPPALTPELPLQVEAARGADNNTSCSRPASSPAPTGRSGNSSKVGSKISSSAPKKTTVETTRQSSNTDDQTNPNNSGASRRINPKSIADKINKVMETKSRKGTNTEAQSCQPSQNVHGKSSANPNQRQHNHQINANTIPHSMKNGSQSQNSSSNLENQAVAQKSTNPAVAQKSKNPAVAQKSTNPAVAQKSTNPAVPQKSSQNPAAVQKSQNPAVSQKSSQNSAAAHKSQNSSFALNSELSQTSFKIPGKKTSTPANTQATQPSAISPRHHQNASASTTRSPVPSAQNAQQRRLSNSSVHTDQSQYEQFQRSFQRKDPREVTPFHNAQNQFPVNGQRHKYQNLNNNASPPNSLSQMSRPPTDSGLHGAAGRQQNISSQSVQNGPRHFPTAGNPSVSNGYHQNSNGNGSSQGARVEQASPEEIGYFSSSPTEEAPVHDYKKRNSTMNAISRGEIGTLFNKARKSYCKIIHENFQQNPVHHNLYRQTDKLAPYVTVQKAISEANNTFLEEQTDKAKEFISEFRNKKHFKKDILRIWLPVFLYSLKFEIPVHQAVSDFVLSGAYRVPAQRGTKPEIEIIKDMFPQILN